MSTEATANIPFGDDQAAQARGLLGAASSLGYETSVVRVSGRGFRVPQDVYEEFMEVTVGGKAESDSDSENDVIGDVIGDVDADKTTDEKPSEEAKAKSPAPAKKAAAKKTAAKKTAKPKE